MIKPVKSLAEARSLARTDAQYARLLVCAAHNLGGSARTVNEAYRELCDQACSLECEYDDPNAEQSIVDEVNFCRDLIDAPDLQGITCG